MLILSTFNSDYLQTPAFDYPHTPLLKSLFEKFTTESINIKYVNKNLIGELLNLNLKESKSCAILFRLFDFLEIDLTIDENKLTKHLNLILERISVLKGENSLPCLVFLCPSPKKFLNEKLKKIEKSFIKKLNKNRIHTLTLADVQDKYSIFEYQNPVEDDTHIPFTPEFYAAMACLIARKLHVINQKSYKVIAVDCDNTLWTGAAIDGSTKDIVFEEHNILLQEYLKKQKEKGIIICLCSRNLKKETVLDVFKEREAEMPLKLNHIHTYKINDQNKSENIKELALELNLFPDSFRFIDDNPIEIFDVSQIPGVFCITMPQNSKEYKNNWGLDIDEHSLVTETDKIRTEFYEQAEFKAALATKFNDPVEYLRSPELGQSITISKIYSKEDIKTIQRVSQLSGKTNQFNMFPIAKAIEVSEIITIIKSDEREIFIGKIKDNFSPEDITAVAVISLGRNNLTIDSFFVSCRVFRRGMEYEMLKHIAQFSQKKGLKNIKLKFKKSEKNSLVCDFLNTLSEETNKDPISRFLLNESKTYALIHDSLKLDEEFILTLSTRNLIDLELDSLIRTSLNVSQQTAKQHPNKLTEVTNKIDEKYLIELKQMTSSLDYLLSKFFIDNSTIKTISISDDSINQICIKLLGEEGQSKSLVARGLDSLKATELRYYLYQIYGVNVPIQTFLCEKTTVAYLIKYIADKKQPKEIADKNHILYNQVLPVAFQQQSIWFAEKNESAKNSANYHMTACYKLSLEKLDIQRLKLACQELVNSYDVFGARFFLHENKLMQLIKPPGERELSFQIKNLNTNASLEEAIQCELDNPWKMSNPPLIRFIFFINEFENNGYFFLHGHHAIFDAISFKNSTEFVSQSYNHLKFSSSYTLKNNPPQYIDYIYHQQKKTEDKVFQAKADNAWREILGKVKAVTKFPSDISRAESKSTTEQSLKRYEFSLSSEDLLALKNLAQLNHVTCFTILYAAFALVVASYTFQKNITLVTATNGRSEHPSFDKMIGLFVILLVQPFELEATQSFVEYLKKVNEQFLISQEHQEFPIANILKILSENNDVNGILERIGFVYQSYEDPEFIVEGEKAERVIPKNPILFDMRDKVLRENPLFEVACFAKEIEKEINFVIEYYPALSSDSFIQRLAENYKHTIREVIKNPNQSLGNISVVCEEEQNQLRTLGQGPIRNSVKKINLVNQFQQSLRKNPENIALTCGQKRLSYKEVDQQSTNLAHALIEAGVMQGNYVGIFLDTNYLFFIAELAILKIGAVFIPLSKENPNARLQLIINDAKISFFIVDDNCKGLFDTNAQEHQLISIKAVNFIHVDKRLPQLDKSSDEFCVLYTSGSTGTPKGVILQEKGIFRVVESPNFIEVLPGDRMSQTANQAFDAAQLECWLAWNHGANLVLFDKETILNIDLFRNKLKSENITHMWLTAGLFDSHANNQPDLFKNLRYLMVGGDVVHKDTVLKVLNHPEAPIIINGYGPTEASIFVLTHTFNKLNINNYNTTLIGSPINETTVDVLTPFGTLAPLGGIGELFVRGEGVAKGYLNLSSDKNSFTGELGNRNYRTGDLVKYTMSDSQIMFMGRVDTQQDKILGNLVAREEVRNCLSLHPAVKQVEVLFTNIGRASQLVAFYTLKSVSKKFIKSANEEFHEYLINRLPAYMIPTFYIQLDVFIVNANGKLDKAQFQKFEGELYKKQLEEIPPQTPNGKALLKIIKKRLPFFPNNIKANFMNFGCDSISAMEIINTINNEFKLDPEKLFHANDLYRNPSVAGLKDELNKILNNRDKKDLLRILKSGDNNLPSIVFIHPAGGGLSCFDKLIGQVKFDNICYGIEDPLLDSNQLKLLTMQEMARNYLSIIINEIQGSFILVGYSFGGMLALEMAAQNESTSENPQKLKFCCLIDTWVVSCISELKQNDLKREVLIYCKEQREKANFSENSSRILDALEKLCEHHQEIGFKFKPSKLTFTPVCLLKATILNDKFTEMHNQDENNFLLNFLDVEQFESRKINATHYDILEKVDENSLVELFSDKVNEFSPKNCLNNLDKKLGPVAQSKFFTTPLTAITNDSNFISTLRNQN